MRRKVLMSDVEKVLRWLSLFAEKRSLCDARIPKSTYVKSQLQMRVISAEAKRKISTLSV